MLIERDSYGDGEAGRHGDGYSIEWPLLTGKNAATGDGEDGDECGDSLVIYGVSFDDES